MLAHPRAGHIVRQRHGYSAFVPAPLPPDPPVNIDSELQRLIEHAALALGRLDGVATILPNVALFLAMYVRHEAVLSSQIEGTQCTLEDILEFEVDSRGEVHPKDVLEVVNYVRAMNHGLERLRDLPLCLRLIREIHHELLTGVRGSHRTPGEFRRSQNWIGAPGCTLAEAAFVPPPPHMLMEVLGDLEKHLHDETLSPLVHCGLVHVQFETIHPFLDGNGRVGRLLITLFLCHRGVLSQPLLYLSYYFKARRAEYYRRLSAVRSEGDWEGWLRFFLRGVISVSQSAAETALLILCMARDHRAKVARALQGWAQAQALGLLDHLLEHPIVTTRMVADRLGCSYGAARTLVRALEQEGILRETTGHKRNRRYAYTEYIDLFTRQTAVDGGAAERPEEAAEEEL